MATLAMICMQSLADAAREEAERRRLLEQQGIEGKVITSEQAQSATNGNLTLFTSPVSKSKQNSIESSSKERKSIRSFSGTIQKIDRTIRQNEERLQSKRARLQSQRWEITKGSRGNAGKSQSQLQEEIQELELKLEQLRMERLEVYRAGRKAGFLPGELDGKGIIP
jgi:excinuclease UvrABC helicase subunit UvrB